MFRGREIRPSFPDPIFPPRLNSFMAFVFSHESGWEYRMGVYNFTILLGFFLLRIGVFLVSSPSLSGEEKVDAEYLPPQSKGGKRRKWRDDR